MRAQGSDAREKSNLQALLVLRAEEPSGVGASAAMREIERIYETADLF